MFALAPIIGAPEGVAGQLRSQLEQAGQKSRIGILPDRDPRADFSMRGYLVAARDKGAVKLSYIWDVTDATGKRVNRITGEEIAAAAAGAGDTWAAITPQVSHAVADKVASSLAAWAPSQPKSSPVAAATAAGPAAGAGAGSLPPGGPAVPAVANGATTNATTASLPRVNVALDTGPVVTGAGGDGNQALASALRLELAKQGVNLAGTHSVEAQVTMGAVKDGKQPVQIDWRVKDAKGAAVGTVTQKNSVAPGSLDGSWGKTADAAAAAAAQGIIKLLPNAGKATN